VVVVVGAAVVGGFDVVVTGAVVLVVVEGVLLQATSIMLITRIRPNRTKRVFFIFPSYKCFTDAIMN